MDNSRLIELLTRKWADEATQAELAELSVLMDQYPDAVYYEEFFIQLWHKSAPVDLSDVEISYQAHKLKFCKDFAQEEPVSINGRGLAVDKYLLAGFAVCLLFFFGLFYVSSRQPDGRDTQIVSGKGIRKKLKLPDGTLVWLNAASKLTFDSDINNKKVRIVHLEGEAFFDVAHAKDRPFIVYTNKAAIKVLGTAFNIKAYPSEKCSETTLLRGSIEFSVIGQPDQKIRLNPSEKIALKEDQSTFNKDQVAVNKSQLGSNNGQKLTLTIKHMNTVKIGQTDYIEETSWKDNSLVFNNETLEQLKPKLERWFNVTIQINSDRAKAYHFTGIFKNETINQALTALQLIKPFTFEQSAHDVTIY